MREYKETNVDWIGQIPLDWKMKKIKRVFETASGYGFPDDLQGQKSGDVPFFKVSDFPKRSNFIHSSSNYVSYEILKQKKWKIIEPMSIITAKIGEAMNKNHRKINTTECLIDNNMMALIIKEGFLKYNFYLMGLLDFRWFANPGAVPSLNNRQFRESSIVAPPLTEQKKITYFLDQKTANIDSLIADKEKLIELLEEKRQAVITETVTKGLYQDTEMKDSGVKWIGLIPAHWEVSAMNLHFSELKTKNVGNKEKNVLSLSYGKIKKRNIDDNFGLLPESFETYRVVKNGDIVLRLTDLQNDKKSLRVGLVNESGIITSAYLTLTPNEKILSKYASLLFHAYDLFKVFYGLGSGVRQSIGYQDLKKLPILLPNIEEQKKISNYLYDYMHNLDDSVNRLKNQINKLKEYRQSLIFEAVTGKIDVQEMINESEQEEVPSS